MWICGVDEAGRGPLVGAVLAGAVLLNPLQPILGLKDSKKLTPARRELLYAEIMLKAKAWGIGEASPPEIDQLNILQATMLAMQAISAASILAKVSRDRQMDELHARFPQYGFNQHMGYPTPSHYAALTEFGICPEHRMTFGPVRRVINGEAP